MTTDKIADCITRIRNAQSAKHHSVAVVGTKVTASVLDVLKKEGFIEDFSKVEVEGKPGYQFNVSLKYFSDGRPVISEAVRVSTSGRRIYQGSESLPKVKSGLGIALVSTSAGVMTDREARKRKLGGEVLALVG